MKNNTEEHLRTFTSLKEYDTSDKISQEGHVGTHIRTILKIEDPREKAAEWTSLWEAMWMCNLGVEMSPQFWLDILEDDIIGPLYENRHERIRSMIDALPKRDGYPVRSNHKTLQRHIYVNGEWELVKFGYATKTEDPYDDAMSILNNK